MLRIDWPVLRITARACSPIIAYTKRIANLHVRLYEMRVIAPSEWCIHRNLPVLSIWRHLSFDRLMIGTFGTRSWSDPVSVLAPAKVFLHDLRPSIWGKKWKPGKKIRNMHTGTRFLCTAYDQIADWWRRVSFCALWSSECSLNRKSRLVSTFMSTPCSDQTFIIHNRPDHQPPTIRTALVAYFVNTWGR